MSSERKRPLYLLLAAVAVALLSGCDSDSQNSEDTGIDAIDSVTEPDASDANDQAEATDTSADPYTIDVFDDVRISSVEMEGAFVRRGRTELDWGTMPVSSATLVVELDTTCYPFEDWTQPPAGHNWPADCDAFDRNFEFILDHPEMPGPETTPGIELVRAITPFGGPLDFEVDITDLVNGLPGQHTMDVQISTFADPNGQVSGSEGGWNVTARVEMVPGPAPREVLAVVPLFDGNVRVADGLVEVPFEVPEGTSSGVIEYRVTGHGGAMTDDPACIGPSEEFCRRNHDIQLDGQTTFTVEPWRDDCAELCTLTHFGPDDAGFDYCLENPTGAIWSVEAPRANWCPGDVTPPYLFRAPVLMEAGMHTFGFQPLEMGEGSWRTSAVYLGFGD